MAEHVFGARAPASGQTARCLRAAPTGLLSRGRGEEGRAFLLLGFSPGERSGLARRRPGPEVRLCSEGLRVTSLRTPEQRPQSQGVGGPRPSGEIPGRLSYYVRKLSPFEERA